jgi:pyruvate-ferredoxin/flavodoxin oxidoreductase
MHLGSEQLRARIADEMKQAMELDIPADLKAAFQGWLDVKNQGEASRDASAKVLAAFANVDPNSNDLLARIWAKKDHLVKKSIWIIGGDGWAYDIGYGGLDHVIASGDDVNLLVLDTEVYSNTGGQSSKATPQAAVAKFATAGKRIRKKDLGLMSIAYGYVYTAQIALGANFNQTLKVIQEAEAYPGPSVIIAYAPCISHGIENGMGDYIGQTKKAVDAGYWHMYRYNPTLADQGQNPFILDSKPPSASFRDFLMSEVRYTSLLNTFPDVAEEMFAQAEKYAHERYMVYKRMTEQNWG